MPYYQRLGLIPPKRHTMHRVSPGYRGEGIYYEEVVTTQGFSRAYSIVYHLRPPTRVKKVEPAGNRVVEVAAEKALRHHHIKSKQIARQGDPLSGRVPIFSNAEVTLLRCRPEKAQAELYRNASADEIIFVHRGAGSVMTMFGVLPFRPFDYVVIPRCTTYEMRFDAASDPDLLVIE